MSKLNIKDKYSLGSKQPVFLGWKRIVQEKQFKLIQQHPLIIQTNYKLNLILRVFILQLLNWAQWGWVWMMWQKKFRKFKIRINAFWALSVRNSSHLPWVDTRALLNHSMILITAPITSSIHLLLECPQLLKCGLNSTLMNYLRMKLSGSYLKRSF